MTEKLHTSAIEPEYFSSNPDPFLTDLGYLGCCQISGADSASFLQGQLTNDVDELSINQGQLTSYCTPKGRMLAIFYLIRLEDAYLAIMPKDIIYVVLKRLQMFILRSKVEINRSENTLLLGACALSNSDLAALTGLDTPNKDYQLAAGNNKLFKVPGIVDRYIYIGEPLSSSSYPLFTDSYWKWLDIMSGIPSITESTQEAFVPQMANMELIDGVSFSKGCYPGQEVVARLHYLGNANRRMFRIECDSEQALIPGDDVYTSGSEQSIGKIVSAVQENSEHNIGLAVIRIDAVLENKLSVRSTNGSHLDILPLPYNVPLEQKEKKT
ncbi:MAG: folate-binding protein [Pseudomonadota bacterium]